jgi:class 3 adenylate cyclase
VSDSEHTERLLLEQAVLFADLGESTRLYEQLGDARAHDLATGCLQRLAEVVERFGGRIVKHIGDEVMCTFPEAEAAVEAARDMQRTVTGPARSQELTIHVGLHWGPVLPDRDDVFGDAVNVAARMVALARPGQILTTGAMVDALEPASRAGTRWVDRRSIKGKREELDIYEVIWQETGLTAVISVASSAPGPDLLVKTSDVELRGGDRLPAITIGRAQANDVVIEGTQVSRWHARLERRGDKWVLCDVSTNGTLLEPDGGERVLVHREELVLPRSGRLGAGPEALSAAALPVRFEVVPTPE